MYIHQHSDWPLFRWNDSHILQLLADVRHAQGALLGAARSLGFTLQREASLETITLDVVKSSEIEGERLDEQQVKSSVARRLGLEIAGSVHAGQHIEGVVELMLDATQHFDARLTEDRLAGWHSALFPAGRSGMRKIVVGGWRQNMASDPMQVVSGPYGRERVHFEAPPSDKLVAEMRAFLKWFNAALPATDPVLKAAVAHLWFLTIHPFEDGNGRIARALTDLLLARADGSALRFYSMSAAIQQRRKGYYSILESTQRRDLDITPWLLWFLDCLGGAIAASADTIGGVLRKAAFWRKAAAMPLNPRQQSVLNRLLDGFMGKLTSSKWAKIANCSQDTAARDIQGLVALDLLVKDEGGGRSTSYSLVDG